MKVLLDTHVVIWALTDDVRLSEQARRTIYDVNNIICFSTVSLWEIALKNQKSPEKCPYHEKDIMEYCSQAGFLTVTIQPAHVLEIRGLQVKTDHVISYFDPFDRMLLAQAKHEKCVLLTHDQMFENYDENCIMMI